MGARLEGPFDRGVGGPGGWVVLIEPEVHLGAGPDKLAPDLAGWRTERFPSDAFNDDAPGFLSVAPDWVGELLRPRTEATDRSEKLMVYAREAVGHVWLVNPALQTLEVYRLERGVWVVAAVHRGSVNVQIEPFEEVAIDLGSVWVDRAPVV
jgi:Uma2 family endonuclease